LEVQDHPDHSDQLDQLEYLGSLVLQVHKGQLVPTENSDLLDQEDQLANLGLLDNREIEVTQALMVRKVRLADQV
jgi:hypothetical protein